MLQTQSSKSFLMKNYQEAKMGTAIFFINTASLNFSDELFASTENVSMEITFSEARIKIGARNYQMVIRMQR